MADDLEASNPAQEEDPNPARVADPIPARNEDPTPAGEDRDFVAKVIRSFIRDGRLVTVPAKDRRRQVVSRYLRDAVFIEDRPYPEREVNMRLALYHRDVATIRRGMVDAGLVTREAGMYRRGRD